MKKMKMPSYLLLSVGVGTFALAIYFFVKEADGSLLAWIILSYLFVNSLLYLFAGWGIYKKNKWAYLLALFLPGMNMFAVMFDDVGWVIVVISLINSTIIFQLLSELKLLKQKKF